MESRHLIMWMEHLIAEGRTEEMWSELNVHIELNGLIPSPKTDIAENLLRNHTFHECYLKEIQRYGYVDLPKFQSAYLSLYPTAELVFLSSRYEAAQFFSGLDLPEACSHGTQLLEGNRLLLTNLNTKNSRRFWSEAACYLLRIKKTYFKRNFENLELLHKIAEENYEIAIYKGIKKGLQFLLLTVGILPLALPILFLEEQFGNFDGYLLDGLSDSN